MKKLRIGVAGLGRAFTLMAPTFAADARVELVAVADPRPEARLDFQGKSYSSVEELCKDPAVEVVYVATPHQFHAEQARLAASHGKHLLVEKPMALTLEDCRSMIDAARKASVALVIGHSHSFDRPILQARKIIEQGLVGKVRMIMAFNFTDFLYRPRRPEELATEHGGGVVFNQAAHHVDMVRLLGGGEVRSVRAATGAWDRSRPTEGAYCAFLAFRNGTFASIVYSGYAHFDSVEFSGWSGASGHRKDPAQYGLARQLLRSARDELALKYGRGEFKTNVDQVMHSHFGTLIVSCDRADLRPLPSGVMIYGDAEQRLDPLPPPEVPRAEVIDELYGAIVEGRAPLHSGQWALATMEVCLAILRSAREQKEVALQNQIAWPT